MKSLILREHEVRRLLDAGSATVVREVRLHPDARPNSAFPARDGMPVFLSGFDHETPDALRRLSLGYANGIPCPVGAPGEQRWVRETWNTTDPGGAETIPGEFLGPESPHEGSVGGRPVRWRAVYRASSPSEHPLFGPASWRSSAQMPRWASRAVVEVASVRVCRVDGVTEAEAEALGIRRFTYGEEYGPEYVSIGYETERFALGVMAPTAANAFHRLWRRRNKFRNDNPWVWVASVSRVEAT